MKAAARFSKWLFYLAILPATLGIAAWQGWEWWSWASAPALATQAPISTAEDPTIQVQIPSGTSAQQIGEDLKSLGLIRSTTAWDLWTRWQSLQNREGGFLAGSYELSPREPLDAIANKIWNGEVVQRSFTVPEGWSLRQMAEYFEAQGFFTADAFLQVVNRVPRDRYPWLPASIPHLEGFLYPDTYVVAGDITPEAIVDQMLSRFQQVALPLYEQSQSPYDFLEWVTLASIVEKESVIGEERPQIASVFARRLRESIPLGADPTVEYALGIRQTPDQPLTYRQVETPSPYNTYLNAGLPPTPISSPGLASLEASINPDDTEFLYFVARYDGTHVFSRTLAEHQAAQTLIHDQMDAQGARSTAGSVE